MALLRITSPHAHGPMSTQRVMQQVLLAALPGIVVLTYFFGFGTLVNILWGSLLALSFEALALKLRGRDIGFYLKDYSALVTATLLGIAMPPYAPWWLIAVGIASAIILAKHLYGGLGYNPFNPAMVGYVVLLISFPVQMTAWTAPRGVGEVPGLLDALQACFLPALYDGVTQATPLDVLKQNNSLLIEQLWEDNPIFGRWAGLGWEWANLAFLAGGAWLLYRRIFTWHAPVAMLLSIALLSAIFYDGGSSASGGSPLFHLLSGATMFGAFFIVTDPVTSAVSLRGRLIYGALIGMLVYIIRVSGNYPDAIAFAVLIMNFAAPFIDHYTQPPTYGHRKKTEQH
ncbi:electron transport complex subunit RsxD [Parahaliea sp. F7430]|uniref:Ion-translocating oxidoreductase complex subunit D n=1 Tax=Sediminihaliea albiluteola TaxID=2758564 RepID=A0A7W2TVP2_9GAMM|nr:electron transport complex subunit RsxD [Sediminihaliea albiluteola]MBA6412816.1 electron transport complex subunit RsxD [Sediminihaliea albiluteola]